MNLEEPRRIEYKAALTLMKRPFHRIETKTRVRIPLMQNFAWVLPRYLRIETSQNKRTSVRPPPRPSRCCRVPLLHQMITINPAVTSNGRTSKNEPLQELVNVFAWFMNEISWYPSCLCKRTLQTCITYARHDLCASRRTLRR